MVRRTPIPYRIKRTHLLRLLLRLRGLHLKLKMKKTERSNRIKKNAYIAKEIIRTRYGKLLAMLTWYAHIHTHTHINVKMVYRSQLRSLHTRIILFHPKILREYESNAINRLILILNAVVIAVCWVRMSDKTTTPNFLRMNERLRLQQVRNCTNSLLYTYEY